MWPSGVHENFFPVAWAICVVAVHRLEVGAPHRGRDEEAALRPQSSMMRNASTSVRPTSQQVAVEGMGVAMKRPSAAAVGQIHVEVGRAAEITVARRDVIAAGEREPIGPAARPVDRVVVDGEPLDRGYARDTSVAQS